MPIDLNRAGKKDISQFKNIQMSSTQGKKVSRLQAFIHSVKDLNQNSKSVQQIPNSSIAKEEEIKRAATVQNLSQRTPREQTVQQFAILNKRKQIGNIEAGIIKYRASLSQLKFQYQKSNKQLQQRQNTDDLAVYQKCYKKKNQRANRFMELMINQDKRIKSETITQETIENIQKQIIQLSKQAINQIQDQYREKEKEYQMEITKELDLNLNIKISQVQNKLVSTEFTDGSQEISEKFRNRIKEYIKQTLLQEKNKQIKKIQSEEMILEKQYQIECQNIQMQKSQNLFLQRLQQLQRQHKEGQENYQRSKRKFFQQLQEQKFQYMEKKEQLLQLLMIVKETKQMVLRKKQRQQVNKKNSLYQQLVKTKEKIIKDRDQQKQIKLKDQLQKIREQEKIVSYMKSKIQREKLHQSLSNWSQTPINLNEQSQNSQLASEIKIKQIQYEISQFELQINEIKNQESLLETIKEEYLKIQKKFQEEKQKQIKKSEIQIQKKIQQEKKSYESLIQQKKQKECRIKQQILDNEQGYRKVNKQKQKQLQILQSEKQMANQIYFKVKTNLARQIQNFDKRIKQKRQECDLIYKNKKEQMQKKNEITNIQRHFQVKWILFSKIYSRLFQQFSVQSEDQKQQQKKLSYSQHQLILSLQDYSLLLNQYQKIKKIVNQQKEKWKNQREKQIQLIRIKFNFVLDSLKECKHNSEKSWLNQELYQATKNELQLYNTFPLKKQKQIKSIKMKIQSIQNQIKICQKNLKDLDQALTNLLYQAIALQNGLNVIKKRKEQQEKDKEKLGPQGSQQ